MKYNVFKQAKSDWRDVQENTTKSVLIDLVDKFSHSVNAVDGYDLGDIDSSNDRVTAMGFNDYANVIVVATMNSATGASGIFIADEDTKSFTDIGYVGSGSAEITNIADIPGTPCIIISRDDGSISFIILLNGVEVYPTGAVDANHRLLDNSSNASTTVCDVIFDHSERTHRYYNIVSYSASSMMIHKLSYETVTGAGVIEYKKSPYTSSTATAHVIFTDDRYLDIVNDSGDMVRYEPYTNTITYPNKRQVLTNDYDELWPMVITDDHLYILARNVSTFDIIKFDMSSAAWETLSVKHSSNPNMSLRVLSVINVRYMNTILIPIGSENSIYGSILHFDAVTEDLAEVMRNTSGMVSYDVVNHAHYNRYNYVMITSRDVTESTNNIAIMRLILDLFAVDDTTTDLGKEIYDADISTVDLGVTTVNRSIREVEAVMLHFDTAYTGTIDITFDSADGANYDAVLLSDDVSGITDYIWQPSKDLTLAGDEQLLIEATSQAATHVYVTVKMVNRG